MGQLIDDLLIFSRMGRQEMLRTSVNLDQLVKTVIHDLRLDLQGRTISWTIGSLPEVYGDPAMLRQVFTNLLSNALKFTRHRAGAKIEIGATQPTAGETEIFVRDNGAGFDMQYVNKLFGVFQRLHRNDEFEGTGIGLANVRRIIHRHGGRTRAEGAVDRGATFFFTLPTKRVVG
jgi:light-regulated signal transduction histidine kinase (bacteriophytochrome)